MGANKVGSYYYLPEYKELQMVEYSYEGEEVSLFTVEELKYHKEWRWLMPVVKKILYDSYTLEGVALMKKVQEALITCELNKTYEAVINFLNWYYA